jgi:NADH-quinone oxidoreductase subunit J
MMTEAIFYFLAGCAVVSAIACITQRNPVAAALCLVGTMFSLAAIYVLLNAHFIGAIQVLVYAGAVMVLFLFVIMLLNLDHATRDIRAWPAWVIGVALVTAMTGPLLALRWYSPPRLAAEATGAAPWLDPAIALPGGRLALAETMDRGVVGAIATPLFTDYLVPFEITSVLLLTAAVGAVVLAKRKL